MMTHTEKLTRYVANFIDELATSGVTDVVISPGSRSTPLAMTVLEHPHLKEWIIIDERSEERRVGKECTSRRAAALTNRKNNNNGREIPEQPAVYTEVTVRTEGST